MESPVLYIECDVPNGMGLREWRVRLEPPRPRGALLRIRRSLRAW